MLVDGQRMWSFTSRLGQLDGQLPLYLEPTDRQVGRITLQQLPFRGLLLAV